MSYSDIATNVRFYKCHGSSKLVCHHVKKEKEKERNTLLTNYPVLNRNYRWQIKD